MKTIYLSFILCGFAALVLIVAPIMAAEVQAGAETAGWQTETVDAAGNFGTWNSLAMDRNGYQSVAYIEKSGEKPDTGSVTFSSRWKTEWKNETVESGQYFDPAVALDKGGNPYIVYGTMIGPSAGQYGLRMATKTRTGWKTESVPTQGSYTGRQYSIATSDTGTPWIVYTGGVGNRLYFASKEKRGWKTEVADQDVQLGWPTLQAGPDGSPRIVYTKNAGSTGSLVKYAYKDGKQWKTEVVSTGKTGGYTSLAFDSNGNPRISYTKITKSSTELVYGSRNAGVWNFSTVDTGKIAPVTQLGLDKYNNPLVVYITTDSTGKTRELQAASQKASGWKQEVIVAGSLGDICSLALTPSGLARVSYASLPDDPSTKPYIIRMASRM